MKPIQVSNKEDLIAIIAPSSPFTKSLLLQGIKKMESFGFNFLYDESIFERSWNDIDYLVGSPEKRAFEIMKYFENPKVKAIISARGGYGANLVAELLDYDYISKHPKIFMGFSDLTFLLNSIYKNSNIITFHGPMLGSYRFLSMTSEDMNCLNLILKNPKAEIKKVFKSDDFYNPKNVEGTIIGGNLTLLTTMLGTPYDLPYDNKILFLEDTNEPPYKIHRNLVHLAQAGKLRCIKGIIFGEMLSCSVNSKTIFDYLQTLEIKVPILTNFPSGHGDRNLIIPIGGNCTIDSKTNQVIMQG